MRNILERRIGMIRQRHSYVMFAARRLRLRGLDRSLLGLVPKPPSPPVRCLMQRDTVNPRLEAGLAMEVLHAAKHFQEDVLRGVRGIRGIIHYAINQSVYGLLELSNQPGISRFRAGLQLRNDRRLFLRPKSYRT